MEIEYKVKDSSELKKLEDVMKNFPCFISPDNIGLEVEKTIIDKTVIMTPKYISIERIRETSVESGFKSLEYNTSNPRLTIKKGDYTYIINLKCKAV